MIQAFKQLFNKILAFFFPQKTSKYEETLKQIRSSPHSCALCALYQVLPEFTFQELSEAFRLCTEDSWPNRGVTNKEFNITLKYLDIFDRFLYNDNDTSFHTILHMQSDVIVLIHGHYTVVQKGQIRDQYGSFPREREKVYCYWILK